MVKVGDFEGVITDITTRYTVIRAASGREAIVPNETLITTTVQTLSLADRNVLLSTVVGVDYDTDVQALRAPLVETLRSVPRVLAEPGPAVQLTQFAADGLELTLYFWIADPENGQGNVRSEVNLAVLERLRREGVGLRRPPPAAATAPVAITAPAAAPAR
jgi:small-conductance mechanosensitive channel